MKRLLCTILVLLLALSALPTAGHASGSQLQNVEQEHREQRRQPKHMNTRMIVAVFCGKLS